MTELRDIPGLEGRYAASVDGKIYSHISSRFLCPAGTGRYLTVGISCGNNKKKCHSVHRLVASAWIPKVSGKHHINHKDGNRRNNNPLNLEWCTPAENVAHSWRIGLSKPTEELRRRAPIIGRASNLKRRVLSREAVRNIRRRVDNGEVQAVLSREYKLSRMGINRIVHRVTYKDIP